MIESNKILYSCDQRVDYYDYDVAVPLDKVELVIQNNMPALRLVMDKSAFERDITKGFTRSSLKEKYGKELAQQKFWKEYEQDYKDGKFTVDGKSDLKWYDLHKHFEEMLKTDEYKDLGKEEDALKNFTDIYVRQFKDKSINAFRESDSQLVVYLPDNIDGALEMVEKLKEFQYRGNQYGYDGYHGERHKEEGW